MLFPPGPFGARVTDTLNWKAGDGAAAPADGAAKVGAQQLHGAAERLLIRGPQDGRTDPETTTSSKIWGKPQGFAQPKTSVLSSWQ